MMLGDGSSSGSREDDLTISINFFLSHNPKQKLIKANLDSIADLETSLNSQGFAAVRAKLPTEKLKKKIK